MSNSIIDCTQEVRHEMWRRGYRPVPILNPDSGFPNAGKRPAGTGDDCGGWQIDARKNPPYAVATRPLAIALNTGIMADGLQAVDVDVDDADLADAINRLAVDMLGDAPMRFREDSPRTLHLYRAADGEPPHDEVKEDAAITATAGREKQWGVEVLGHGNQFLAMGVHPDGAILDWKDGLSPTSVSRDELPAVTETQIDEFLSMVGNLLGSKRLRQNRQNCQRHLADDQRNASHHPFVGSDSFVTPDGDAALADARAALAVIPGDGGSYKPWMRVGMATFAATDGSLGGLAAFDEWSRKSPKYNSTAVQKIWRTFRPHTIGFGSLVHMAREVDPSWRAPSWSAGDIQAERGDVTPPTGIVVDILNRNVAPPPIMPLSVFGTGWGDWLPQAAAAANAPADYVATALLAVAGSLIGNARWGQAWDGWAEPTVLWCALVGEPSASKTPAANAVLRLLRDVEADMAVGFDEAYAAWEETAARIKAERKQWESSLAGGDDAPMPRGTILTEPMRPLASTGSVTVEKVGAMMQGQPKGFLIANDELAGWLSNMQRYSSGTDRPFWLTAYTGSPYRADRKTSATAIIPCLSLGIFGTIQPDRLAAVFQGADDGLPARFLFCWPEARPFARPRGAVNVAHATEALCKLSRLQMSTTEDGSTLPIFIAATEEAAQALTAFAREMQAQERQAGGLMIGVLGKARGYALRLAVVLEYLSWVWGDDRREPRTISGNAMERAIELMRSYFLPMASRVLGDAAITEQERDARSLGRWIVAERPKVVNLRQLCRGQTGGTSLHGLRDRKRLLAAAEWLQDCGWFQRDTVLKTGGRPRSDFLVADGLWTALNNHACQNGQIRQKPAAADAVEGSVGFGGFGSNGVAAREPEEAPDPAPDDHGGTTADQKQYEGDGVFASWVASEPAMTALKEEPVECRAESSALTLLDRMIAKKRLAESQHRL